MKRIKDEGYVEYIFCLFAIFIACICVVIGIRLKAYNMAKENIENEITDSTLASAIVDMKRFQFTGLITNYDINSLYNKYTTCLQKNLNLKNPIRTDGVITKFEGPNNSLALSNDNDAIKITDYYIYNAELDKKEYYVTKLIENGEVNVNPQPELIASGVEISKVYITMKDNSKKKVFMCDNALSIYAKVNFKIKPFKFTVWKTDYSTKEEIGTLEYLVDSIGKGEHHNYESEIFKEPNCTGDGIIKYKCKDCGYVYYEGIPKLGHSIHVEGKEPTCTEDGHTKEICLRCGKIIKELGIVEKLGHDFYLVQKYTNYAHVKCNRCGYECDNYPPGAPTINMFPVTVNNVVKKGRAVTFTATANDPENDEVTFEWENRPAETYSEYAVGTHTVKCRAKDKFGNYSSWSSFTFTVRNEYSVEVGLNEKGNGVFDVVGNGSIKTTFGYGGYTSVAYVNGSQSNISDTTTTINGVNFTRKSVYDDNLNAVVTTYAITNTTNNKISDVRVAVHSDIQVNNNDAAPCSLNNNGFTMTDGTYTFQVYAKNTPGVDDCSTIWLGYWSSRTNYLWVNGPSSISGMDSGFAMSWQFSLKPNETIKKTFMICVE